MTKQDNQHALGELYAIQKAMRWSMSALIVGGLLGLGLGVSVGRRIEREQKPPKSDD